MNIEDIEEARASLPNNESSSSDFIADEDSPFPLDILSPELKDLALHLSYVYQAPIDLVAPEILANISSSLAKGIRVISNHPNPAYGGVFIFLGAKPGQNKSTVLQYLKKPFVEFQKDVRKENRIKVETELIHEYTDNKGKAGGHDCKPTKADIDKRIGKSSPTLMVEHYTQEGLATVLSFNNEYVSITSGDASSFVDNLKGAKAKSVFQGELLLKGYSGDSYDSNKKIATDEHLEKIRMSINLLGTTQTLNEFISDREIRNRGLLARFCFAQIHDPAPRMDNERRRVDEQITLNWSELIKLLLRKYWRVDEANTVEVSTDDDAINQWVAFKNEIVDQQHVLNWLENLPGRWGENALRFALILHVCRHPDAPQEHVLDQQTMKGGISVMRWFIGREIACMEQIRKKDPEIDGCKELVFKYLNENGPTTIRDFDKKRKILPTNKKHLLDNWVKNGELVMWNGSQGNAPSLRVAIPGDDRIPEDVELITN